MEPPFILLAVLLGVILGYWLQNPALAERERAVRQKLRRAQVLWRNAQIKLEIADGQTRLWQAVRRQADEMLQFASRAPELGPVKVVWERSPVFDSMTGWLAPTGAVPLIHQPVPPEEPKARQQLAKRQRISVDVAGDVRAEGVTVP